MQDGRGDRLRPDMMGVGKMAKRRGNPAGSSHHPVSFRSLGSRASLINNILTDLRQAAGGSVSWTVGSAVDFLIEDRCVLCGKLSTPGKDPNESSGRFTKYLNRAVHQRVFGFFQIANHPVCRMCASDFDETHGPGFIEKSSDSHEARPANLSAGILPGGDRNASLRCALGRLNAVETDGRIPVISPFMTNDPVLKLVHLIKFSAYTALIPLVARTVRAATSCYRSGKMDSCLLIPVPMHPKQHRERGFNQAEHLARELSVGLEIPLAPGILRRNRSGKRQSTTPREKRWINVHGAFSTGNGSLTGKHALLVDDLVTTGATAASCSDALFAAGAASVTVLCLGRSL